jgi:hypothetical protein
MKSVYLAVLSFDTWMNNEKRVGLEEGGFGTHPYQRKCTKIL